MKNVTRASALILAVSALTFMGASAALATGATNTLPAGDSLYIVDSDQGAGVYEMTSSGAQTHLNLQLNDASNGYFSGGALNPVDLHAYMIYLDSNNDECFIDKVDLLGGAPAARIPVMENQTQLIQCDAMTIDAQGNALIEGSRNGNVYRVWPIDLSTGIVGTSVRLADGVYAFDKHPTTGAWYGISFNGDLVSINSTTGAMTTLVTHTLNDVYDGKFDSNGTLWFTDEEGNGAPYQLYSWRVGDSDYTLQGDTSQGGHTSAGTYGPIFVGNSTVTIADKTGVSSSTPSPQPSLSNTGSSAETWISATAAAVVALFSGVAVVAYVRRRATR